MTQIIETTQRRGYNREFWSPRFANRTAPIWNKSGFIHPIEERATARQAMADHNLLQSYREADSFYVDPMTGESMPNGLKSILREKRDGTLEYMATVAQKYEIIQPGDIADLLDTAPNGGKSLTERWPVDCIGLQKENAGFFMTLHAGGYDIDGDPMEKYFLIRNGNDGSTGLTVSVVHIRIRCWNTLTAAIKGAMLAFTIPHRKNANALLRCYTQMIATMPAAQNSVEQAMKTLAAKKITTQDVDAILEKTFALPPVPQNLRSFAHVQQQGGTIEGEALETFVKSQIVHDRKVAAALASREKARELHERYNDENDHAQNTGFSIFQAVTELLDNKAARGASDDALLTAARESLFGSRAQQRDTAFAAIMAR